LSSSIHDDLGKLILRLALGVLLLLHGVGKLGRGVDWIAGMLVSHGLPAFVAYGVYAGEIIAPILIILGVYTRLGGLIALINMLFVFGLVHANELFTLGKSGGWALELQGLFLFSSAAVMLLGAGAFSLGGRSGRWN